MISLGVRLTRLRRLPRWSQLRALFTEWRQRIRSRYELKRLNERDLADMGLTRLARCVQRDAEILLGSLALCSHSKVVEERSMRSVTLEYMSAIAHELANLAEINGYPSLVRLFRATAEEADHLQKAQRAAAVKSATIDWRSEADSN